MVHCYYKDESINKLVIGFIINPSIKCEKLFREQVEKWISVLLHYRTMETIIYFLKNKKTCVMALIIIYENNRGYTKKVYRVLSCVVYYFMENCVFIDCISCQSKILSSISSKTTFEQTSFNILLGIDITELLLNLLSCHGFMKKPNSTGILNCRLRLVNNYLAKVFYIIEKDSKQESMIRNDVKLRINMIDQMDTDFFTKQSNQFPP